MTTKVAKKDVESNFPSLENYENKTTSLFSILFQKYNPYDIIFELRNTYLRLYVLDKKLDISTFKKY